MAAQLALRFELEVMLMRPELAEAVPLWLAPGRA